MKTIKVMIGRPEFDDIVPEGAESRHKIWRDGVLVAYMHSFVRDPEASRRERKIDYRLCDLHMRPLGGRFISKDDVREWVRYDLR